MKMTFENLNKKGTLITVESATSDYGMTNDAKRWWGARMYINEKTVNVPKRTMDKILRESNYKVIGGGYKDGELISTTTKIEIQ